MKDAKIWGADLIFIFLHFANIFYFKIDFTFWNIKRIFKSSNQTMYTTIIWAQKCSMEDFSLLSLAVSKLHYLFFR